MATVQCAFLILAIINYKILQYAVLINQTPFKLSQITDIGNEGYKYCKIVLSQPNVLLLLLLLLLFICE